MNLFASETFKITKPIRMIELFAGVGFQSMGIKKVFPNAQNYRIAEWQVNSIIAYALTHYETVDINDVELNKEQLVDFLLDKCVSLDFSNPATKFQLNKITLKKLKLIYKSITLSKNLGSIYNVNAKNLNIERERERENVYVMTYSFPCQDLSIMGRGQGMKDTSTRSGLLWEVERILKDLKSATSLPDILVMENVPQVHGTKNKKDFQKWCSSLNELGYENYSQDMNMIDYGVPQSRDRTFMVSILGNYDYEFPKKEKLKLFLGDILEKNVDDKYFKSKNFVMYAIDMKNRNGLIRGLMFQLKEKNDKYCRTLTTGYGNKPNDTFIIEPYNCKSNHAHFEKRSIPTLNTTSHELIAIRKLTPLECRRLMGAEEKYYYRINNYFADTSLYHICGDGLGVNIIERIFRQFL